MANTISGHNVNGVNFEIKYLVDLAGTPKQVSWANSIRKRIFTGIMDEIQSPYIARISEIMTEFDHTHPTARYWIDNDRNYDAVKYEFITFAQERMQ